MTKEIIYKNPEYFYLFIGIGLMILWYVWRQRKLSPSYTISDIHTFQEIGGGLRTKLRHIPFALNLMVFSCIIIAIARPQTFDSWSDSSVDGIDIIIANDVSGSMAATDFEPNRLGVAKEMAQEFVKKRPYDRIGIVVFAGESLTQCPLTTDHANVIRQLQEITFDDNGLKDGTAIGMGLTTSINRLDKSEAVSKVVILLTDGVNNRGTISPKTASEIAELKNIKVYTIGVGSDQKQVMSPYGMIAAELDEEILKEIADGTGGKYFRAKDERSLGKIYDEIDELEKTEIDVTEYQNSQEEFHLWIIIAGALLLFNIILKNTLLATMT